MLSDKNEQVGAKSQARRRRLSKDDVIAIAYEKLITYVAA